MERDHILRAFREADGVISDAATRLGVPRTTLNAMMKGWESPAAIFREQARSMTTEPRRT